MLNIKGESMNKFKIGDVVEILNNNHGYSEDFTGQITEIIEVFGDRAEGSCYNVRVSYKNGSYTHLTFNAENLKLIRSADVEESQAEIHEQSSKTKSDGGSSDYYKLEINGNPVEVEDVIYAMVGGDFILGNILKACRRMYLDSKGQGKEGIDMQYDANKIKYFVDSFVKRFGDK